MKLEDGLGESICGDGPPSTSKRDVIQ